MNSAVSLTIEKKESIHQQLKETKWMTREENSSSDGSAQNKREREREIHKTITKKRLSTKKSVSNMYPKFVPLAKYVRSRQP